MLVWGWGGWCMGVGEGGVSNYMTFNSNNFKYVSYSPSEASAHLLVSQNELD